MFVFRGGDATPSCTRQAHDVVAGLTASISSRRPHGLCPLASAPATFQIAAACVVAAAACLAASAHADAAIAAAVAASAACVAAAAAFVASSAAALSCASKIAARIIVAVSSTSLSQAVVGLAGASGGNVVGNGAAVAGASGGNGVGNGAGVAGGIGVGTVMVRPSQPGGRRPRPRAPLMRVPPSQPGGRRPRPRALGWYGRSTTDHRT